MYVSCPPQADSSFLAVEIILKTWFTHHNKNSDFCLEETMVNSKVSIIRCDSYSEEGVYAAVRNGIDLLGGIEQFAKSGEKIVFKPIQTPQEQR